MSALVVTPLRPYAHHKLGKLNHGASVDDEFNYYIWCYGESQVFLWEQAPEGTAVNCLRCLVYGPRGGWERFAGMGDPWVREEMREGVCVLAIDSETHEP